MRKSQVYMSNVSRTANTMSRKAVADVLRSLHITTILSEFPMVPKPRRTNLTMAFMTKSYEPPQVVLGVVGSPVVTSIADVFRAFRMVMRPPSVVPASMVFVGRTNLNEIELNLDQPASESFRLCNVL